MRAESRPPGLPLSMRMDSPAGVTMSVAAPPSTSDQITSRRPSFCPPKTEVVKKRRAARDDFILNFTAALFVFFAGAAGAGVVAADFGAAANGFLLGRFAGGFGDHVGACLICIAG